MPVLRLRGTVRFFVLCFVLAAGAARLHGMIDLDGNRLNDLWELYFHATGLDPNADDDGDGETNLEECLLWTDPHDPKSNSKAHLHSASANDLLVQFLGPRGVQLGLHPIASGKAVNPTPDEQAYLRERLGDTDSDGLTDYEEKLLGLDPLRPSSNPHWIGGDLAYAVSLVSSGAPFHLGDRRVVGTRPTPQQSARFLMQATLGGTMEDIRAVSAMGYNGWIHDQFRRPPSITQKEVFDVIVLRKGYDIQWAWWHQVLTADDLLRQRMATALTEIYVVSERTVNVAWELMKYYDDLDQLAFGRWPDLLHYVTYSPIMGHYLSHLNNRKADPKLGRYPDENYAREVMQLFSIGLWELNPDGTHQRDAQGREIPTYDNTDITNFARVFTGFGFSGNGSDTAKPEQFFTALPNYADPMQIWPSEHDLDAKRLLHGLRLPAFAQSPGRKPTDDVDEALDSLFHHPNVGPFVSRLLIQRLVTSNPSPEYIRRVAQVFADNGRGERGDLKAVIKAILLDTEARNPPLDRTYAGRLREPYLRYVRLGRTFHARSIAGTYKIGDNDVLEKIDQSILDSPSVFNFFLPDFQPPGRLAAAHVYAPEFQITTSSTAMTTLNLYMGMIRTGFGDFPGTPAMMTLDFSEEVKLADRPEALLDLLDLKMACGELSAPTRRILLQAYREMPASYSPLEKVKALAELITISPDFAVLE